LGAAGIWISLGETREGGITNDRHAPLLFSYDGAEEADPGVVTGWAQWMGRDQVVSLLRQHEPEFRDAGVAALFLFGSVARDQARDVSDVDLFFDLAQPEGFTLFDLVALQQRMREILGAKVDLMTRKGIHPRRRPRVEAEAIQAF
jgi:predicted nucleotidyltransferase